MLLSDPGRDDLGILCSLEPWLTATNPSVPTLGGLQVGRSRGGKYLLTEGMHCH